MLIAVRAHPGASREAVELRPDGTLEVWVRKPAVDGKANEALVELLAKRLGVPRSAVRIVRGANGRTKTIHVPLADAETLRLRLAR
jgi:uncharacterized protein (TIGR00251 family)